MWILDKFGEAYDLGKMIAINCDSEHALFKVKAWTENAPESKIFFPLADFDNRDDAKAYIADLVHKLNGGLSQQEFKAVTALNDLVHIRDELNIIYDLIYPPLNRDNALNHTKELISYVESLIAEMEGANQ